MALLAKKLGAKPGRRTSTRRRNSTATLRDGELGQQEQGAENRRESKSLKFGSLTVVVAPDRKSDMSDMKGGTPRTEKPPSRRLSASSLAAPSASSIAQREGRLSAGEGRLSGGKWSQRVNEQGANWTGTATDPEDPISSRPLPEPSAFFASSGKPLPDSLSIVAAIEAKRLIDVAVAAVSEQPELYHTAQGGAFSKPLSAVAAVEAKRVIDAAVSVHAQQLEA